VFLSLSFWSLTTLLLVIAQRGTASKDEQQDLKREKKWRNMLRSWDKVEAGRADRESKVDPKFQKKLRQRVLKGIPNRLRGQVWTKLALIQEQCGQLGSNSYDPVRLLLLAVPPNCIQQL
jgi:hypothetical protein